MDLWEAALLGLIQGLTEFLPVSSSGHLVIFQDILGVDEPGVTLEVLLHFGTLLSVFWVFGRDFINLFTFWKNNTQRHFLLMLIVGTIVTAIVGFTFSGYVIILFKSTLLVGIMLIITGGILKILTLLPIGKKSITDMNIIDSTLVGLFQGLAVIPGISRSGSTIFASTWRGLDRNSAIKYSFMLSAPVILGANLLEFKEILTIGIDRAMLINYIVGGLIAFISGIVAIKMFIRLLSDNKFNYFTYYCWAVGMLVIVLSLVR